MSDNFIGLGDRVTFDYHNKARFGSIAKIGNGPGGVYVIITQSGGSHKTFSQPKISNLRRA